MEMVVHGFKYSKVHKQENDDNVGVSTRVWRSVKRVAGRFMRRRPRKLAAAAVVVRRAVLWASVQLIKKKRKSTCKISGANNNNNGQQVIMNYDMFSYSMNFDDGKWQQEEVDFYARRSFSYREGQRSLLFRFCTFVLLVI
ncbi:hypothetical protein LWI28_010463 [Acer negundo]|uniref:Uncharacterized protein n=1 Tax=Acer negundo TaxID=4023 RepID=A0AAD5IHZ3_ACENE|nr:hypothetical protein LWI28_010463 [Acer negundo]KAK4858260.1 hypothetical protein QYF36_013466 [Acer negundo]